MFFNLYIQSCRVRIRKKTGEKEGRSGDERKLEKREQKRGEWRGEEERGGEERREGR